MLNKTSILQRFPAMKQVAPIYALTFFLFNAWTMYHLIWKLPAWLYYLKITEILPVVAYSFSINLLESLVMVVGLAGLAAILPEKWFRDVFIPVSTAFTLMTLGYLVLFLYQFFLSDDYPTVFVKTFPVVVVGIFFLASWLGRIAIVHRMLEAFADRTIVFLYIFLPLGIISLVTVFIINLF